MMSPEVQSLIRKECRERRLPLAIGCGWMVCCVIYAVAYETTHRFHDPVATFYASSVMYSMLAAVLLAMKTALGEQTQGTLEFSRTLPVSRIQLAMTKLAGGITTLVVPMLLGACLITPILLSGFVDQFPVRPNDPYIPLPERSALSAASAVGLLWTVTAISVASGVQLLLILSVFGARRKAEAQIGFFGAAMAFGWMLLPETRMSFDSINGWLGAAFPVSVVISYGYGAENGSYHDLDVAQPVWGPLAVNLIVLALLCGWFVSRYATGPQRQRAGRTVRRWYRPAIWSRVPIPLPSRAAALVWVNLRQSLPIAISGLLMAALITIMQYSQFEYGQSFRSQLPSSTWIVAIFWATIVGTGIFAAELQPGLSNFWRSRPINVGTWFWFKFVVGLLAVLVVLDGVTIFMSWGTRIGYTTGLSWSYIACMPILHAMMYSLAVLGVCWTRRPVVAALSAIVTFFVSLMMVSWVLGNAYEPINIHNDLIGTEMAGNLDLAGGNYLPVYGTLLLLAVVGAGLASVIVRRPVVQR